MVIWQEGDKLGLFFPVSWFLGGLPALECLWASEDAGLSGQADEKMPSPDLGMPFKRIDSCGQMQAEYIRLMVGA